LVGAGILFAPLVPVADQLIRAALIVVAVGMFFQRGTFDGLRQYVTRVLQ
jgi:hypothetical protein